MQASLCARPQKTRPHLALIDTLLRVFCGVPNVLQLKQTSCRRSNSNVILEPRNSYQLVALLQRTCCNLNSVRSCSDLDRLRRLTYTPTNDMMSFAYSRS